VYLPSDRVSYVASVKQFIQDGYNLLSCNAVYFTDASTEHTDSVYRVEEWGTQQEAGGKIYLHFDPEDGGSMSLQHIDEQPTYTREDNFVTINTVRASNPVFHSAFACSRTA
jgi:hypothetical protein